MRRSGQSATGTVVDLDGLLQTLRHANDESSWRHLVALQRPVWFRIAVEVTGDPAAADDVLQDACLELRRALVRYQGGCSRRAQAWLNRIVRNVACKHARATTRRRTHERHAAAVAPLSSSSDPAARFGEDDIAERVHQELARLSVDQRRVLELRYFQRQDYHGIARQLGCSPVCARKRVQRGLRALAVALKARGLLLPPLIIGRCLQGEAGEVGVTELSPGTPPVTAGPGPRGWLGGIGAMGAVGAVGVVALVILTLRAPVDEMVPGAASVEESAAEAPAGVDHRVSLDAFIAAFKADHPAWRVVDAGDDLADRERWQRQGGAWSDGVAGSVAWSLTNPSEKWRDGKLRSAASFPNDRPYLLVGRVAGPLADGLASIGAGVDPIDGDRALMDSGIRFGCVTRADRQGGDAMVPGFAEYVARRSDDGGPASIDLSFALRFGPQRLTLWVDGQVTHHPYCVSPDQRVRFYLKACSRSFPWAGQLRVIRCRVLQG